MRWADSSFYVDSVAGTIYPRRKPRGDDAMGFIRSVRHNLSNLLNFSGRENRAAFWPYVGFVLGIMFAGMVVVMVPLMAQTFTKMQQFAIAHPDQATVVSGPGSYSITIEGNHPELMPNIDGLIGGVSGICLLVICLLAAAVVRRLHDRGKSGVWGLLPVPFLAFGFTMMPKMFHQSPPEMNLFFMLFFNNLIYLAALATLVVLLAGESAMNENKYGPAVR